MSKKNKAKTKRINEARKTTSAVEFVDSKCVNIFPDIKNIVPFMSMASATTNAFVDYYELKNKMTYISSINDCNKIPLLKYKPKKIKRNSSHVKSLNQFVAKDIIKIKLNGYILFVIKESTQITDTIKEVNKALQGPFDWIFNPDPILTYTFNLSCKDVTFDLLNTTDNDRSIKASVIMMPLSLYKLFNSYVLCTISTDQCMHDMQKIIKSIHNQTVNNGYGTLLLNKHMKPVAFAASIKN